ncbi:MAG: sulfate ABC transporter substrate-binding protein [Rubrobacteraceae bacterium]|nr:sulfate ABC transporter substrate-binding protein [Rubrobacteraceae bacterium]
MVAGLLAAAAIVLSGCGGSASGSARSGGGGSGKVTLNVVGYSTLEQVYDKLIPAFQKTEVGKGVDFHTSYGASGDQSRAVAAGQPADVVEFSLAPDMERLVQSGTVSPDWDKNRYHGMVTDSVVVLVVRKGNPKHIHGWDDLVKPGVKVITPNPFSSGSARWNVMAAYGAQLKEGKSPAEAEAYLKKLFSHVPVEPASGREALQTFTGGEGDVLISYENEAILAQHEGEDVQYIIPKQTILIQNPIAVTKDSKHKKQAEAFVRFLYSPEGQKIFAREGYRPVDKNVLARFKDEYPKPEGLFTINDLGLGGWDKVQKKFFDPNSGIFAKISRQLGKPTQ